MMAPGPTLHDVADALLGDIELPRKVYAALPGTTAYAYGRNVVFAQNRPGVTRPVVTAALGHHVGRVVLDGAEKEVVWPNAPAVVATMANAQATGNRAVDEGPCHPVDRELSSGPLDHPVAMGHDVSAPLPASIRLPYLAPKTLLIADELCSGEGGVATLPLLVMTRAKSPCNQRASTGRKRAMTVRHWRTIAQIGVW